MSGSLNKVMLIGHLGDDIKMHHFDGGGSIGRFPLATNETYTNKNTGEKITNTEWHNIVVRNKAAEICDKYLNEITYIRREIDYGIHFCELEAILAAKTKYIHFPCIN